MLFSHSLALCSRTRAAKKHAKVLLFSGIGNFFCLKVTLFLHFLPKKLKLLNRLCKINPIFAPNSLFYQSLTHLFNSAYLVLKIGDLHTRTPFIISLSAAGSAGSPKKFVTFWSALQSIVESKLFLLLINNPPRYSFPPSHNRHITDT